ncbi:hypothetical protein ONA70_25275 [Micromonospora yasonensis]|uniref:hypothetical protein n=1 Tax=Micromonospora yasonensis TaxID=1128667 RepID=UPI00223120DE|nr:hypothetical protein [Micromonospora yasonensis]MCW3843422.1 hypothetical protein [Micromonospora yasonensis]
MASPTAPAPSRVTAPLVSRAPATALAAALVFGVVRMVLTATGTLGHDAGFLLGTVQILLAVVAFVAAVLSQRGPWHRPTRLVDAGPGRRRVPAGRGFGWFVFGQALAVTGPTLYPAGLDLFRDPEAPPALRYLLPALTALLVAVWLLLVALLAMAVFTGRPRVDLTPVGVEIWDVSGQRSIPWAAMTPGTPARQGSGNTLRLRVARPELVERRGLVLSPVRAPLVTLGWLPVHPWYLADVLRFYVDHPEERAALGTPAGDERLRRALGVG